MFATIGHTFELMKMSWRVLMQDRELILFPVFMAISMVAALAVFGVIAMGAGTFDRLDAAQGSNESAMTGVDYALGAGVFFVTYFIGIFFNSALVAAALERLRGGNPTVGSGLSKAMSHLPAILGWAVIAATVGLVLQILRDRMDNFIGRLALSLVGGVWAYMTFFVVPLLVSEGIGPVGAIKRSSGLFQATWGRQVAAGFGFGIVYVLAGLAAAAVTAVLFFVHPIIGVAGGAIAFAVALGTVAAMEGIFKAALYEFAMGESPIGFDRGTLSSAYRAL
ncbi:MAG: DUF6159 family protein [Dehalococcoidia bacterium]